MNAMGDLAPSPRALAVLVLERDADLRRAIAHTLEPEFAAAGSHPEDLVAELVARLPASAAICPACSSLLWM